jgi:class 3 adenylate cyclase/tetratricopeptide (TPR) repeat protein
MNCPKCLTINRSSAKFCKHCGNLLIQACPRCNTSLPEAVNFCDYCGLRLVDASGFVWWLEQAEVGDNRSASSLSEARKDWNDQSRPYNSSPSPTSQSTSDDASLPDEDNLENGLHSNTPTPTQTPENSPLQQYIPPELYKKLEAARVSGTMAGERRIVTMLFCDVKDSTEAAELFDPEEWSEIINGAFEHMIRPVYRYEGTVARLMGDSLLAFFGAPIAHEDDPQRAVLAALDIVTGIKDYSQLIKEKYEIDLGVRVGINTGLVVVGSVGSDLRMEYTALGDAINLAARMEQTAELGTIQIAHDTYKLVKSLFEIQDLGAMDIKGKHEPVNAYRVIGRKSIQSRQRGVEGLYAEMVGREAEMLALRNVISYLRQGVGQITCVLGEAGLGKTRLISETGKVFDELIGQEGYWYETASLSYETNQAYGLFQRLIRRMYQIAYDEPPEILREKLGSIVESLGEDRRTHAKQILSVIFGLESENGTLPLEGEAFKRELLAVMEEWLREHFKGRPAVLVFDDMHWSDAASIELLLHLLPLIGDLSLVLICAMRSERQAPAWKIKTSADELYRHRFTEVSLRPLSDKDSSELVDRLLAYPELPSVLRASILEKAGGNPFFIEELVSTLIENGVVVPEERILEDDTVCTWHATTEGAEFALPDNLQSLLSARIDRLEETTRGTLQVAAVIGRSFYHRVLQSVDEVTDDLDERLRTLQQMDMIREEARVPELEYSFRNPLTQEAVYQSILLKRRREFHRRVGEAIEALYKDRLDGMLGLLAHHFALAGQTVKSIAYAQQSARISVSMYAYDDAIHSLTEALGLVQPGENSVTRLGLLEQLADVYRLLRNFDQAISFYQQALSMCEELSEDAALSGIRLDRKIVELIGEIKWSVGIETLLQVSEVGVASRDRLVEMLEVLQSRRPDLEIVRVLVALSNYTWRVEEPPDWEKAQQFAQSAIDKVEQLESEVDKSKTFAALASVLDGRSLLRQHQQVADQRLVICRQSGFSDVFETIDALRGAGAAKIYVGEYSEALPYLHEAANLAERSKVIDQQVNALGLIALALFRLDRWDEVLANEERWRELEKRHTRERVGET